MSTSDAVPSPPTDLAKLDELEAVTRKYSLYGRSAFGLGHLPGFALLVLGLALNAAGIRPWGIMITAVAPWVWLATREPIRKRLYQREGRVTERPTEMDRVRLTMGLLIFTILAVTQFAMIYDTHHGRLWKPDALPVAAAPVSVLALAAVAWFHLRSGRDAANWYLIGFCVVFAASPGWAKEPYRAWLLFIAIASTLGIGLEEHIRYRRLERRLANLRTALEQGSAGQTRRGADQGGF